jgi:prophage DNA circulation protein
MMILERSETCGKLALALAKAQGMMEDAKAEGENSYTKSRYTTLSACIRAARPALSANEIAVTQTAGTMDGWVVIITLMMHSSGEWISGTLALKPRDMTPQNVGSAITYGRRYGYKSMVGLSDAEDDDDANAAQGLVAQSSPSTGAIDAAIKRAHSQIKEAIATHGPDDWAKHVKAAFDDNGIILVQALDANKPHTLNSTLRHSSGEWITKHHSVDPKKLTEAKKLALKSFLGGA